MYAITKNRCNIYRVESARLPSHSRDPDEAVTEIKEPVWAFVTRGKREVYTIVFPDFAGAKAHCMDFHRTEAVNLYRKASKAEDRIRNINNLHEAHVL